jgi:DNA-directed RNA polymerase sigma subunit (sigma70/sigma32)
VPALDRLPPKARLACEILVERYGLDGQSPCSLEEVSERHGLSRLDVRLIESRVLRALAADHELLNAWAKPSRHARARVVAQVFAKARVNS